MTDVTITNMEDERMTQEAEPKLRLRTLTGIVDISG